MKIEQKHKRARGLKKGEGEKKWEKETLTECSLIDEVVRLCHSKQKK